MTILCHKPAGQEWIISYEGVAIHTLVCVTHDRVFHADDVAASAMMKLWSEVYGLTFKVARTREVYVPIEGEMVITIDVGGVYDSNRLMFDHHQADFAEVRANGVPLASAGLIWYYFGYQIVEGLFEYFDPGLLGPVLDSIDRIVAAIDGRDCGKKTHQAFDGYNPLTISDIVSTASRARRPFEWVVDIVAEMFRDLITVAYESEQSRFQVQQLLQEQKGNEILILESEQFLPWQEVVAADFQEALFMVSFDGKEYKLQAVQKKSGSFETKALLPAHWAGLNGADFQEISGYLTGTFCHRGRWIAGFSSKDDAIRAAHEALQAHHLV